MKLQKKLPTSMLSSYHRWLFEKQKTESVERLREWVLQEAEFQTKALEAVYGLTNTKQEVRRSKRENPHTFFGRSNLRIESNAERQHLRVCIKFAVNRMGHGHAQNLNRWRYKKDGIMLNDTSCVFIV